MKKVFSAAFLLSSSIILLAASQGHAQTLPATAQQRDNYPAPPSNSQQRADVSATVYSSAEYPTAQGHYLKLPTAYQKPAAAPPPPPVRPVSPPQYPAYNPPPSPPVAVRNNEVVFVRPQNSPPPAANAAMGQPRPASAQYPVTFSESRPAAAINVNQPQPAPVSTRTVTPTTLDQLPSYSYDARLDPRRTYKTPLAHDPKASGKEITLATMQGSEVGLQVSGYRYQEHAPGQSDTDFVRETGPKFGATFGYTGTFPGDYFITGEVRAAYGQNNYTGTGTASGIDDWIFDLRALGGTDFVFDDALWGLVSFDVSPYAGFGFRYLYNNFASVTGGYDRYSHYLYIPVGVTPRFRVTEQSRLSLNAEFDYMVYGWQLSEFSNTGGPDLNNAQNNGYGLRASAMWEWPSWSVGPFINYWNIGKSETTCADGDFFSLCGLEPNNQTLEAGFQGRYRF